MQRYLLTFHYYQQNKTKISLRSELCFKEPGSGFKRYWTNASYSSYKRDSNEKLEQKIIDTEEVAEISFEGSETNPEIKIRFLQGYRKEVTIGVHLEPGSTNNQEITKISFDASADADDTILRTRLTSRAIESLRKKIPEFTELSPNDIQKNLTISLERIPGGTPIMIKFLPTAEGQINTANSYDEKYFKSEDTKSITPGRYRAIITIKAGSTSSTWATIEPIIQLNPRDLSPVESTVINESHIFSIDFDESDIKKDICTPCADLLTCLACVDNTIVTSYQK